MCVLLKTIVQNVHKKVTFEQGMSNKKGLAMQGYGSKKQELV